MYQLIETEQTVGIYIDKFFPRLSLLISAESARRFFFHPHDRYRLLRPVICLKVAN